MNIFYPKYYERFSCIASACPDSCCKEWSVDIDAQSATHYRALPGSLGDRLRQVLQDTDDGTIMTIENGRCPMWRQDGLCRIQAELGHDALCKVCREFPRLRHDYGDFVELGLELSCPEAARLILSDADCIWVANSAPDSGEVEYDQAAMNTLRRTRKVFCDFLSATSLSVPQILAIFLLYAYDVQEELDGGTIANLTPERHLANVAKFPLHGDIESLLAFFMNLEILTPGWKERLQAPACTPVWDSGHKALLRYFIDRYWLQAISDFDIVCRVKFILSACILIGYLGGDLAETSQIFSKEIENDPDNMAAILNGAYSARALTDLNLLGLLLG